MSLQNLLSHLLLQLIAILMIDRLNPPTCYLLSTPLAYLQYNAIQIVISIFSIHSYLGCK